MTHLPSAGRSTNPPVPPALPDVFQRDHRRALPAGRRHVRGLRPVGHQPAHRDHLLLRGHHHPAADHLWLQVRPGAASGHWDEAGQPLGFTRIQERGWFPEEIHKTNSSSYRALRESFFGKLLPKKGGSEITQGIPRVRKYSKEEEGKLVEQRRE